MSLEGKVALVTGGGSGIGESTARLLASEGVRVGVLGRGAEKLEKVAREIVAAGGEAIAMPSDIAVPEKISASIDELASRWGRLDIVFANAGINGVWAPIDELEPDEWRQTVDVNLNGTYLTLHYAVPHLKKRQGSSIVITSSINGTRRFTGPGATAYACTKAAQVAMAQMLALELAKHKIRVNVICPGDIVSQIEEDMEIRSEDEAREPVEYPAGEIPLTPGSEDEAPDARVVANLVRFLVSDRASHITGTPIWIDGGESLLQG
jgi:NAD(P)-dependent dehydrogenase (short-subunit alcohol dehydrogenase family)